MSDYLKEFKRLTTPLIEQLKESPDSIVAGFDGDKSVNLIPMKNKAREAIEALNDVMHAANAGRSEDAIDAMRRARAVIDSALGAGLGVHGAAMPQTMRPERY